MIRCWRICYSIENRRRIERVFRFVVRVKERVNFGIIGRRTRKVKIFLKTNARQYKTNK
jgi:hypothetical protein